MKANDAPEKIYIPSDLDWQTETCIMNKRNVDDIEYTRTDAFIDRASRNYADNEEYGDDVYFSIKASFKAGANWQKEHLWKPADGEDLPIFDREVIALEGIVDPTATDCFCGYKVVFAHRPTPEGYNGKSITTGVVEHYTPETYGEGGWNVPNIAYWLDIELPKEIEL